MHRQTSIESLSRRLTLRVNQVKNIQPIIYTNYHSLHFKKYHGVDSLQKDLLERGERIIVFLNKGSYFCLNLYLLVDMYTKKLHYITFQKEKHLFKNMFNWLECL